MSYREINFWLNERRADALQNALGVPLEDYFMDHFTDIYATIVPENVQAQVAELNRLEEEQSASEKAEMKSSAFHITQGGNEYYVKENGGLELLKVAELLRKYLSSAENTRPMAFKDRLSQVEPITSQEYEHMIDLRLQNTGQVPGVFDIDFDKCEFSAVHIMDGWKTYCLTDVSTAAYHAFRRSDMSDDRRLRILVDKLDGKEISSAGHLSARELSFEDEICEIDDRLNFYISGGFDVDAVFGTFVITDKNDDWLNVYANYDMPSRKVCDTLDIVLHRDDGADEELSYSLNLAEKEILHRKMDEYCLHTTGMSMDKYCERLLQEEQAHNEPTM